MARSGANDKRYLELHRGKWRVTVAIPKELQGHFGTTRLKQSLKTDSLTVANQLKWPVVAEMKAALAQAAGVGSASLLVLGVTGVSSDPDPVHLPPLRGG